MPDSLSAKRLPFTLCRTRTLGAIPVQLAGPVVAEPFSDVQLGPLLGKGAFGKVHIEFLASKDCCSMLLVAKHKSCKL